MENTYFRKGFGLKGAIAGRLTADYHSGVVEALRASDYRLEVGPLTFRLAREFGFCYGVDRAVEYAYETRTKFPGRRLFLRESVQRSKREENDETKKWKPATNINQGHTTTG